MSQQEKRFSKEEVESLARKLDEWGKGLQSGERALLRLLIASYGQNVSVKVEENVNTELVRKSMGEATIAALQRFIGADKQEMTNPHYYWRRTVAAKV